jgi:hypothetical protein
MYRMKSEFCCYMILTCIFSAVCAVGRHVALANMTLRQRSSVLGRVQLYAGVIYFIVIEL